MPDRHHRPDRRLEQEKCRGELWSGVSGGAVAPLDGEGCGAAWGEGTINCCCHDLATLKVVSIQRTKGSVLAAPA